MVQFNTVKTGGTNQCHCDAIQSWTSATLSRDFDILSGQFTDRWRQESPQKGVVLFQLLSSLEVEGESVAMIIKVSILGKMILLVTNQL